MDKMISILIADDNIEFGNVLHEYLNQCEVFCVKGVARDGLETIDMLKEHAPDVVILDLIMPNLDGIGVLEKVQDLQLEKRPVFIILTAVGQDGFIQKAVQLGAEYYMVKPFDVGMLVKRIIQLHGERVAKLEINMGRVEAGAVYSPVYAENRLEAVVTSLIKGLGIIPNIAGFHYLREAVLLSVEDTGGIVHTAKDLYAVIAGKHNTTAAKVSRSIRNAIQNSKIKSRRAEDKNIISAFNFQKRDMTNTGIISLLAVEAKLLISK